MKPNWIHVVRGRTARGARVGTVGYLNEEFYGRAGFFGPTAILYHGQSPSEVQRIEGERRVRVGPVVEVATADGADARGDFEPMLRNSDLVFGISRRQEAMSFCYRNTVGDLLHFVHRGTGVSVDAFEPLIPSNTFRNNAP